MATRTASNGEVVNTYVKALFELALEQESLKDTRDDLRVLEDRLRKDPFLMKQILKSGFGKKDKDHTLKDLTEGMRPLVQNFMGVLNHYGRLNLLVPIMRGYEAWVQKHLGFLSVCITSASSLEAEEKSELEDYLKVQTGKGVIISFKEDSQILGGFTLQMSSTLIDCSLRGKIKILEKSLKGIS